MNTFNAQANNSTLVVGNFIMLKTEMKSGTFAIELAETISKAKPAK